MRSILSTEFLDPITPQYLVENGWTYNPTTREFNKCIFNDHICLLWVFTNLNMKSLPTANSDSFILSCNPH